MDSLRLAGEERGEEAPAAHSRRVSRICYHAPPAHMPAADTGRGTALSTLPWYNIHESQSVGVDGCSRCCSGGQPTTPATSVPSSSAPQRHQ
eukprot:2352970-Prymnesium_polylepis.1